MKNRLVGIVVAMAMGGMLADCGSGKSVGPDAGAGGAGHAGGGAGGVGGGAGAGGAAGDGAGGAGCIFGVGGIFGAGGHGEAAGETSGACVSSIVCGSETCTLGQQYCVGVSSGGGSFGTVTHSCVKVPAACPSIPGCDCLCPGATPGTAGCNLSSDFHDCSCSGSNGALIVNCTEDGEGGAGGAGGCPFGLGGFNGANAGGNGGGSSGVVCATPPFCGFSACATDREYCRSITFMGGAGNGGGRTGNNGSGGSDGVGGGGGMTDPNHTCTSLPAACAGTPSCACACPSCPTTGFPEACSCSVVNGEVIVSCTEFGS